MKETLIEIKTELEKVNAIRICLSDKETDLEKELTDYIDTIYKKYVPVQVREFIEKADAMEIDGEKTPQRRVTRRKPVCGESLNGGVDTAEGT